MRTPCVHAFFKLEYYEIPRRTAEVQMGNACFSSIMIIQELVWDTFVRHKFHLIFYLLNREDDLERLAYKKRRDMEKKLESLEDEIELKTKR